MEEDWSSLTSRQTSRLRPWGSAHSPEISPVRGGWCPQDARAFQWGKQLFQQMLMERLDVDVRKSEAGPCPTPAQKGAKACAWEPGL